MACSWDEFVFVLFGVAIAAKSYAVSDLEAESDVGCKGLYVMGMQFHRGPTPVGVARATLLARVVIPCEHSSTPSLKGVAASRHFIGVRFIDVVLGSGSLGATRLFGCRGMKEFRASVGACNANPAFLFVFRHRAFAHGALRLNQLACWANLKERIGVARPFSTHLARHANSAGVGVVTRCAGSASCVLRGVPHSCHGRGRVAALRTRGEPRIVTRAAHTVGGRLSANRASVFLSHNCNIPKLAA
jgi:hypothetical protein